MQNKNIAGKLADILDERIRGVFFSVVIPCYNVEKTVARTLDSVRDQTFTNYEIVAVDDGSTDSTLVILQNYVEKSQIQMKVISQENKGLGGARNTGIKNATYEFITFLDADDLWYPEKLLKVARIFEKEPHIDLVCHDEDVMRNGEKVRKNIYGPYCKYEDLLFRRNCLSGSAVAVRKSTLMEVGLFSEDRTIHGVEDYDLWLKLAKFNASFYYLHETLGAYVLHDSNMTGDIESFFERDYCLLKRHVDAFPDRSLKFRFKRRVRYGAQYRSCGRALLSRGDYKKAFEFAQKSLQYNPFSVKNIVVCIAILLRHEI